tara:strand:+ start:233 stop:1369 length:1137 start_codon:yes stop_codon:yes gene_type:complete
MLAKRRKFGKGKEVSLFTLGTMRALKSKSNLLEVIQEAFHSGINHIETAKAYGDAEKYLGKALKITNETNQIPEGGWVITTKILPKGSLDELKDQIMNSLDNLGIDKLNNLAIHGINTSKHLHWSLEGEGSKFIEWAFRENIIEQIGFSSHGNYELIEEAIESKKFEFCSLHLHLLEQSKIPLAIKALNYGLGVMAISPAHKGGGLYAPSEILKNVCSPYQPLEMAYRFLIAKGITTLTIGASKPSEFKIVKKLCNSDKYLDNREKEAIEKINSQLKSSLKNTLCEQCGYCIPCPNQIPIPEILRLRNLALGLGQKEFAKERYNLIGKAGHWWETSKANDCNNCGDCLPRCPNNLSIPNLLKETHTLLNDSPKRRLWE